MNEKEEHFYWILSIPDELYHSVLSFSDFAVVDDKLCYVTDS